MGFTIADDATSVSERASSNTGFIDSDLPLLQMLRIVEKKRGVMGVNKNIVKEPVELRDFLTWAAGQKKTPLPPLARRILCLKRAIVKNSIASIGTASQQRTGEKRQLEEIDALLKADGVINLDNAELCQTEGSKWVSKAVGGVPPAAAAVPGETCSTKPSCATSVSCDNAALVKLISEIKENIATISQAAPGQTDMTAVQSKVQEINERIIEIASVANTVGDPKAALEDIVAKLAELKPSLDAIPALKTLVENIKPSVTSGVDVTPQLTALQTLLESYKLEGAAPVLEQISTWLNDNTLESQLKTANEKLDTVVAKMAEQPAAAPEIAASAAKDLEPQLLEISSTLNEQFGAIKADTTAIKAGVEGLSTNTKGRDEQLLTKIEEQTGLINNLMTELKSTHEGVLEVGQSTIQDFQALNRKLNAKRNLVAATTQPVNEERAAANALARLGKKVNGDLNVLRANNANGRNNASITRIADLEAQIANLTEQLSGRNTAIADYETRIHELEEQTASLQGSPNKNGTIRELTNQSAERQAKIEANELEIAELKAQIKAKSGIETLLEEANTALANLRAEMEAMKEEKAALEGEIEAQKLVNKNALAASQQRENAYNTADAARQDLQSQLNAKTQAATNLQSQLNAKTQAATNLQSQLNAKTQAAANLQSKLNAQTSETKEADALLLQWQESYDNIDAMRKELEASVDALTAASAADKEQIAQLRKQLEEQLAKHSFELAERNATYNEQLNTLTQAQADAVAKAVNAGNKNAVIAAQKEQLNSITQEKGFADKAVADLRAELTRNKQELLEAQQSKSNNSAAIQTRIAGLEAQLKNVAQLTEESNKKDLVIKSLREQIASLESIRDSNKTEIDELLATIDSLQKIIEQYKASVRAAEAEQQKFPAPSATPYGDEPSSPGGRAAYSPAGAVATSNPPRGTYIEASAAPGAGKPKITYSQVPGAQSPVQSISLNARNAPLASLAKSRAAAFAAAPEGRSGSPPLYARPPWKKYRTRRETKSGRVTRKRR